MSDKLTQVVAESIVARMGENGQPPERGISFVNVGNEALLDILDNEYLARIAKTGVGSTLKLVQGYYGGGKTHFLYCVRDMAWRRGFVTALVSLSPQECPYENPYLVYKAVASSVSLAPLDANSEPVRSLPDLLREFADTKLSGLEPEELANWLRTTARRLPCDSHAFRRAAMEFLSCCLKHDYEGEAILESWLLGDNVPRGELRRFGIFDAIERGNAFQNLCSLVQVLVGYGYPGVVMLFDEVDRNLSMSTKRIQSLGDNLRQVIDLCGSSRLPGVLFLYAVPPDFMRTIVPEYPALDQRLSSPLAMTKHSPQSTLIDLGQLDLRPVPLLAAIGARLLEVCMVAWDWQADRQLQLSNINLLAEQAGKHVFEIWHRRLFVKLCISLLRRQYLDEEVQLTEDEAVAALDSAQQDSTFDGDDFE